MFESRIVITFTVTFYILLLSAGYSYARPENENVRYISDVLVINIKDRLEKPYEVVATVQSDEPVSIIEESGNYLKVETAEGKQGWIAKHYLKREVPKALLIKQLTQEIEFLKNQLNSSPEPASQIHQEKESHLMCQELSEKLADAEKHIVQLTKDIKAQEARPLENISSSAELSPGDHTSSPEQFELTPENYALLVSEYEKRGKIIADLQKTVLQKEDRSRFLWFGAGALVFLVGLLAGKARDRKKNKFVY